MDIDTLMKIKAEFELAKTKFETQGGEFISSISPFCEEMKSEIVSFLNDHGVVFEEAFDEGYQEWYTIYACPAGTRKAFDTHIRNWKQANGLI
jgi:hypothetical protein